MGFLISLEGGEGSGKSTQAQRLWERLRAQEEKALLVQEPGSTPLGWALRNLLKSHQGMAPQAELALFAAARAELVQKVLKPELAKGTVIVADRYVDSTVAYQGYGRRLSLELIHTINAFVTQGLKPRRTFLLDLAPEEGLRRLGRAQLSLLDEGDAPQGGRADQEDQRRFEEEPLAFHRRVRQGYLALAKAEPDRFVVLDASKPPADLEEAIWRDVLTLLASVSSRP